MRATLLALVPLLGACSSPPQPAHPTASGTPVTPREPTSAIGPDARAPEPPAGRAPVSQEETLAAIQKAMNELDEAVQGCWAAAATERFDVEGELLAHIDVGDPERGAATTVALAEDTAKSPRLASCVTAVLTSYAWAPPLRGQSLRLPFRFRAPAGQNVIDRRLVAANGQGGVSIAVLLDEANTGNDAASMLEVAIAAGGTTDLRRPERDELWYFLAPATVEIAGREQAVAAGDMLFAPKGSTRAVRATTEAARAVVVLVPGGREGTARAGALPAPAVSRGAKVAGSPAVLLPAATATRHGAATIHAEPATTRTKALSASVLALPAGSQVTEHVHAGETEILYVLSGSGTMTIAGVAVPVTPTSVIQIPPNTKHAFTASDEVRAVQLYTPAGPEQRFKQRATK